MMKKKDVVIGGCYMAKVSGKIVPVKLLEECQWGGWVGKNMITKREVRIKTAAKLRYPYSPKPTPPSQKSEFDNSDSNHTCSGYTMGPEPDAKVASGR